MTIRYDVLKSGVIINSWTSEQHGADYYEPEFGLPQRTLVADADGKVVEVDGSTPDLTQAIGTGVMQDSFGGVFKTYIMPAQYSVVQTDISASVQLAQCIAKRKIGRAHV